MADPDDDREPEDDGPDDEPEPAGAPEAAAAEASADEGEGAEGDDVADEAEETSAAAEDEPRSSNMVLGLLGFLVALGIGFYIGQWVQDRNVEVEVPADERFAVALRGDEPQIGPDDALVTIIEFADYQCPYCAQAHEPLKEAVEKFDGDVRLIYKHFPLPSHNRATPAAKLAWAAHQQDEFWPMHAVLFEKAGDIDAALAVSERLGLDKGRLEQALVSEAAAQSVDDDLKAGAMIGVRGTPAFFVNGHAYRGLKNKAQWVQILENELAPARKMLEAGTPRAQIYDALMRDAKTQGVVPPPAAPAPSPAGGR
jgi:protein-disulfide isomerase